MRQRAVADQDAQAAGLRNAACTPEMPLTTPAIAEGIVRPAPLLAADRDARRYGAIDVGEIPRLDIAVGPAGAREHADGLGDLLLEIQRSRPGRLV